jgi:hypothetical protein
MSVVRLDPAGLDKPRRTAPAKVVEERTGLPPVYGWAAGAVLFCMLYSFVCWRVLDSYYQSRISGLTSLMKSMPAAGQSGAPAGGTATNEWVSD